ncbi:MAG: HAMP domain-containing histidine kinase [Proteobacteria bacterium]|nr:HAMP domain-containing histidine kinase [Pseudomonadota bacterium]
MKSLNKKLSVLLLFLFIVTGVSLGFITRYASEQYHNEITQRLNGSIAMYVTNEAPLISNGQYNEAALKHLAHQAMVINPTVEVYLLVTRGKILSHNLPAKTVLLNQVPLNTINTFLQKGSRRPLLSVDPRSPDNDKPFSVAKVINNGVDEGYVYVILGGQTYEALANDISKNYIMRLALAAIGAVIVLATLIGILMLTKLTRPLKLLRDNVMVFQKSITGVSGNKASYTGDEIEQLEGAFTDMSTQINRQLGQIKQADQTRRDLISNVSHDLRTPLASMQGYLDTLLIKKDQMDDAEMTEYLSIARKHCNRLNVLINDLFELSKLDSHAIKPNFEAFSMSELMQDVALDFKLIASNRNIDIKVELIEGNTDVRADIGLMQRVLENLIENAIKHTPENGKVSIKLTQSGEKFKVIIRDTGRGISQQEIPYIFDRLYRAENTSNKSNSSSGLGLAIVKKILELHKTNISVISKLDKGTQFSFNLPVANL